METLTEEESEKLGGWAITALVALPIICFFLSIISAFFSSDGPLFVLRMKDAIFLLGGPALVAILWICWGWLVWQRKLGADVWVPVLVWAAVTWFFAFMTVYECVRQPWIHKGWEEIMKGLFQ